MEMEQVPQPEAGVIINSNERRQGQGQGQSSDVQKSMACVLSLGVIDWSSGGSTQGVLTVKERGMVPCTFTATPLSCDNEEETNHGMGTGRRGIGVGQEPSMKVLLELDLEHIILDTGKTMPLLKREYQGVSARRSVIPKIALYTL